MAAYMDYQSCRYSSWCPDRHDADDYYDALDRQYMMDAPPNGGSRYGGGGGMYAPPAPLNENEPLSPSAAFGGRGASGMMPMGGAMMMPMMPAASTDKDAATLATLGSTSSTTPFDWRELEASCRKLDEANIRITELDITCMGSPTNDEINPNHYGFAPGGSSRGGGGHVRYGITCERAAAASGSMIPAARNPAHVPIYGLPPPSHLPPSAVHHMPAHAFRRNSAAGAQQQHRADFPPREPRAPMASRVSQFMPYVPPTTAAPAARNCNATYGGLFGSGGSDSLGSDTFSRPRTASSSASSSTTSTNGGSGTLQPVLQFGGGGAGGAKNGSGTLPRVSNLSGADRVNEDTVKGTTQAEVLSPAAPVATDADVSAGGSPSQTSPVRAVAIAPQFTADEVEANSDVASPSVAEGSAGKGSSSSSSPTSAAGSKSSSAGQSGSSSNSGGKAFGRVIQAIAERCQRVFNAPPARRRSLHMTTAVRHRRCNSSERLEQLVVA